MTTEVERLDHREHVLRRPDTYIGSNDVVNIESWVRDPASGRMVHKTVGFLGGLFKIFDEIVVNAADQRQRFPTDVTTVRVLIDRDSGVVSVFNDGKGVPVEVHAASGLMIPYLVFGELLTGTNFNDDQRKTTGGRNGYGAKLTNIWSTLFEVDTADGNKHFTQKWYDNMTRHDPARIVPANGKNYTRVTFKPDYARFKVAGLSDDMFSIMERRVWDLAGTLPGLKVYLNDVRVAVNSFKSYAALFTESPLIHVKSDRWEVIVAPSADGAFHQVSFVNSICTWQGGTHVEHVMGPVIDTIIESCTKRQKTCKVTRNGVRQQVMVFVSCLIENPAFDTQTKVRLTSRSASWGSTPDLSAGFLKKVGTSDVVEALLAQSTERELKESKKTDGRKSRDITGIPKLDDANWAGGAKSHLCTLILTEGDSAKALAVAGISVVGRDQYGVFPLKGKVLNVRDAPLSTINGNEEISNLKKILGLRHGADYSNPAEFKTLRYGHVMIMTDQDHDGSHIKGLLVNLFSAMWPSLLATQGFIREFITPIIKATRGAAQRSFFTISEYETWAATPEARGWSIKYYKGLGTSTSKEAREYFSDLARHQIDFVYEGKPSDDSISLAFSKARADDRKEWVGAVPPGTFLDMDVKCVSISNFVNKELVLYSVASNERAIPSALDGLKPGQRKIMFTCFKRRQTEEVKVAQLAGAVSELSAYHHGEASLASTIVGMAQDYVGSNNLNFLEPAGQFGTRMVGGKDAASPRYIFTRLMPWTRVVFPEVDDQVLKFQTEEGKLIEPLNYLPVIPMALVNGSSGIGTGWSTDVPSYNPLDLVAYTRALLDGREGVPLVPWYRGFKGKIVAGTKPGVWATKGCFRRTPGGAVEITELPVGTWTRAYQEFLEEGSDLVVENDCTETEVKLTVRSPTLDELSDADLEARLKLSSNITTSNMVLYMPDGVHKFKTPEEIVKAWFPHRLAGYVCRREWLRRDLEAKLRVLDNKIRFIRGVCSGEIVVARRKTPELMTELEAARFSDCASLLSLPLSSLTLDRVEALVADLDACQRKLDWVNSTSPEDMWRLDLDSVEAALKTHEATKKRPSESDPSGQPAAKRRR